MNAEEGRVNRGAGEERFAGFAESTDREGESGDESAEVDDFFLGCGIAEAVLKVALEGLEEGGVRDGVSEDAVIYALADRGEDLGRGDEIHIGDPEGIEVGAAVPFERSGSAAGDGCLEIRHRGMMTDLAIGPTSKKVKMGLGNCFLTGELIPSKALAVSFRHFLESCRDNYSSRFFSYRLSMVDWIHGSLAALEAPKHEKNHVISPSFCLFNLTCSSGGPCEMDSGFGSK